MSESNTKPMKVRDLREGDMVDLASAPRFSDEADRMLTEFEMGVVDEIVQETPGCFVVSYENFPAYGYDPDLVLMVRRPAVAEIRIVLDTDDGIPIYHGYLDGGRTIPLERDESLTLLRNGVAFVVAVTDPADPRIGYESQPGNLARTKPGKGIISVFDATPNGG